MNFSIKIFLNKIIRIRSIRIITGADNKKINKRIEAVKAERLSNDQATEIKEFFKEYGIKTDVNFHQLLYSVANTKSKLFIHPSVFHLYIEPRLNDKRFSLAWADKNYYDFFFQEYIFPEAIIRSISGELYSKDYRHLSIEEAKNILEQYTEIVFKPTIDSGSGHGVSFLQSKDGNLWDQIINTQAKIVDKNFLICKKVEQHSVMRALNKSSINIIRVISLCLDGNVEILSATVRVGGTDKFTDFNDDTIFIGVSPDGRLKEEAFSVSGQKVEKCMNGCDYKNIVIPNFKKIDGIVQRVHGKLSHFKMISWDFFINESGEPGIMEYNIRWQGVYYYQYCNGPLFRDEDTTRKVLQYVFDK